MGGGKFTVGIFTQLPLAGTVISIQIVTSVIVNCQNELLSLIIIFSTYLFISRICPGRLFSHFCNPTASMKQ